MPFISMMVPALGTVCKCIYVCVGVGLKQTLGTILCECVCVCLCRLRGLKVSSEKCCMLEGIQHLHTYSNQ